MITDKRCSSAVHRTERTGNSFNIQKYRQFILEVILQSIPLPCETFCAYKNERRHNTIDFTASHTWTHQLKRQQYCYDM